MKRYTTILLLLFLLPVLGKCQSIMNGDWDFALDPVKAGEQQQWYATAFSTAGFDKVRLPHCYSVDRRYAMYTGTAWYFKKFSASAVQPGFRAFLRFDAVFYKTTVWLNGRIAGSHEGGYTPFELDVTELLQAKNQLAVSVNNEWDTTTIPGAKTDNQFSRADHSQLYAWINYGGITRPVELVIRPDVRIRNVQVIAEPDQAKGNARIRIKTFIDNRSAQPVQVPVNATVYFDAQPLSVRFKNTKAAVQANGQAVVLIETVLPAAIVKRWNPDEPHLYKAEVRTDRDTFSTVFGIRSIKVEGAKLLLNGEPIRRGGCNRPLDYPGYGSIDPEPVLEKDMQLIKEGNMDFSRISHYPVSEEMLNRADRNGMLIIAEAGNWQMTPSQMANPAMRKKFQQQMQEMMERHWNHPCIIAYSLGNEFQSQTPEGQSWVKDMSAFVKTLDSTRLITFASFNVWRDYVKKPEDEASQYVDFVSANIYGNHLKILQRIHELYPDKPVYISEFGIRSGEKRSEEERITYFRNAVRDIRACDYVTGASVWTFNDYLSRYPGTDADGYRAWGLVTPDRKPRDSYRFLQDEFAPLLIEGMLWKEGKLSVVLQSRKDFPAYTLRNYQLRYGNKTVPLKVMKPGDRQQLEISTDNKELGISIINPQGFTVIQKIYKP
ncbi:MAG: glycoside hydrolase family 2 protein [Pseudobacter sp.]|uniref:glycoside hydrolase family 2 protein n=1 Tax=Pseudobacter sp. TaxID=2045420 RepID=UPI003F7E5764